MIQLRGSHEIVTFLLSQPFWQRSTRHAACARRRVRFFALGWPLSDLKMAGKAQRTRPTGEAEATGPTLCLGSFKTDVAAGFAWWLPVNQEARLTQLHAVTTAKPLELQ